MTHRFVHFAKRGPKPVQWGLILVLGLVDCAVDWINNQTDFYCIQNIGDLIISCFRSGLGVGLEIPHPSTTIMQWTYRDPRFQPVHQQRGIYFLLFDGKTVKRRVRSRCSWKTGLGETCMTIFSSSSLCQRQLMGSVQALKWRKIERFGQLKRGLID